MDATPVATKNDAFSVLQRFIRQRKPVERCDLCGIELAVQHPHLIEPANRHLQCACQACAILFSNQGDGRFARVPTDVGSLPDFRMTDLQWAGLMLPIQLAFFFNSSREDRVVALYPSPAGPTESLLPLETWAEIVSQNESLANMRSDVEALLVNRTGEHREYLIAPIDECYKLVGLIRMKWTGLSGGTEMWREIDQFFAALKARARER